MQNSVCRAENGERIKKMMDNKRIEKGQKGRIRDILRREESSFVLPILLRSHPFPILSRFSAQKAEGIFSTHYILDTRTTSHLLPRECNMI